MGTVAEIVAHVGDARLRSFGKASLGKALCFVLILVVSYLDGARRRSTGYGQLQ